MESKHREESRRKGKMEAMAMGRGEKQNSPASFSRGKWNLPMEDKTGLCVSNKIKQKVRFFLFEIRECVFFL